MTRTAFCTVAFAILLSSAPVLHAQSASSERILRSWVDDVKLENGSQARWTFTITYDAEAGMYAETITDQDGVVVDRNSGRASQVRPTAEEIESARSVIFADPVLSELFERAANPKLDGGFVLTREEGHACGPGSRCLQFDMFDVDTAARRVNRIRYIVVDARDWTIVSNDFDPSEDGNATRFNGNPILAR